MIGAARPSYITETAPIDGEAVHITFPFKTSLHMPRSSGHLATESNYDQVRSLPIVFTAIWGIYGKPRIYFDS
jgi:hypothetical protein